MYKIGIVGYGVVGKGIHRLFREYVTAIYDPISSVVKKGFVGLDLVVMSVPTDEMESGSADTSILGSSVEWVRELDKNVVILIKSTTPPTKLKELHDKYGHIVFSPEYMGESKYFTPEWKYPHPRNMASHTWQTFGGELEDTKLCVDVFKRRMGVDTQYWQTDIVTAGLAKYLENSFFAMKVTFVNEWCDMAEALGVDWNELRELWLLDPRINRNHTLVFPLDRGYSGKCFPKDTRAIIKEMKDLGYVPELMVAMDANNTKRRKCIKKN